MFKKLTIMVCLVSFCPGAAGAQDLVLEQPHALGAPIPGRPATGPRELSLSPAIPGQAATVLAANEMQACEPAAEQTKTHAGLSFKEFCEVHFGEYRWIYWAGAVAAIVAIHLVAAKD